MSETSTVLYDTAARLFEAGFPVASLSQAAAGEWLGQQWQSIEDMGLTTALVPEEVGGYGVEMSEALSLIRLVGYHAAPVPLAETMLAHWLMAISGIREISGPLSVSTGSVGEELQLTRNGSEWELRGQLPRVPWGRDVSAVVTLAEHDGQTYLCLLRPEQYQLTLDTNLAGEPRDTLAITASLGADSVAPSPSGFGRTELRAVGAAMRCLAIAGATDRILAMSVNYANERRQFGRPIGKFQAIQQNLAVLAAHAASASAAADIAAEAVSLNPNLLAVAAAKIGSGEAAGPAASIAHQVHGAIGFTEEHSLHFFTKRLWAWRDEFGREAEWSHLVGKQAAEAGADGLWALIASAETRN